MEQFLNKTEPLTLRTSLLLIPIIFIVMLFILWLTGQAFGWPANDEQRTTAMYIAVAFSLIPIITYLLNTFSQNRASVGFKAFGTELTVDFSESITTVRQSELQSNLFTPGSVGSIAHSGSEEVIRAISKAANAPVVTIDIKDGRAWWVSRLFALSAGAMHFGLPDAIVFTATKENIENSFIGWTEPRPIFDAIRRTYPEYEQPYRLSRTIFSQLSSLYGGREIAAIAQPPDLELAGLVQPYTYTYDNAKELSFVQILLDQLSQKLETQDPPMRVTMSLLSDLLGHCWHTKSVDLQLPTKGQIKQVFEIETSYIPLVQQGKFVGMMKSQLALKVIVQQIMSNQTLSEA